MTMPKLTPAQRKFLAHLAHIELPSPPLHTGRQAASWTKLSAALAAKGLMEPPSEYIEGFPAASYPAIQRAKLQFTLPHPLTAAGRALGTQLGNQILDKAQFGKGWRVLGELRRQVHHHYRHVSPASWAGSNLWSFTIRDKPSATAETTKVWHPKKTYSTFEGTYRWSVDKNWLKIPEHIRVLDGMITLKWSPKTGKATWVEQGRGSMLNVVQGWILTARRSKTWWGGSAESMSEGAVAVHGSSRKVAERRLRARLKDLLSKERQLSAQRSDLQVRIDKLELCRDTPIRLAMSHKAGNCPSGTRTWIHRHLPDRYDLLSGGTVTAGKLMDLLLAGCASPTLVFKVLKVAAGGANA